MNRENGESGAEKKVCPTCQMPLQSSSLSLTQWIAACNCQDKDNEQEIEQVSVCTICRKRITSGRSGSMTHFIFRADSCRCQFPQSHTLPAEGSQSLSYSGNILDSSDETQSSELEQEFEEEEIPLDPQAFPLERFSPLSILGSGASGAVYCCRDRLLGKRVAIKILHTMEAKHLVSFQKEAKALSALDHPNVVKVLDFGITSGGIPFMVMEMIRGRTLEDWIKNAGPLNTENALVVFEQIARGLAHAHSAGVLHRDVKSTNVIVDTATQLAVHVIDFGVASARSATEQIEHNQEQQSNTMVGSPHYMSADQFNGVGYDARSEIYSLGCCLYEALTGKVPFDAESALALIKMHADEPPPAMEEIYPQGEFSPELKAIVARCLEKDPGKRFVSMTQLADALAELSPGERSFEQMENNFDNESWQHEKSFLRASAGNAGVVSRLSTKGWIVGTVIVLLVAAPLSLYLANRSSGSKDDSRAVAESVIDTAPPLPDVDFNNLSDFISETRLVNGVSLLVDGKGLISEEVLDKVVKRKDCRTLTLKGMNITRAGMSKLADTNIDTLVLDRNNLEKDCLSGLGQMTRLKQLNIYCSDIDAENLVGLSKCPSLHILHLSDMTLGPAHGAAISQMNKLAGMHLKNIRGLTIEFFEPITSITRLFLDEVSLDKGIIGKIAEMPKMTDVRFLICNLHDFDIQALKNCKLRTIELMGNNITDKGLDVFTTMPNLLNLDLRNNPDISEKSLDRLRRTRPLLSTISGPYVVCQNEGEFFVSYSQHQAQNIPIDCLELKKGKFSQETYKRLSDSSVKVLCLDTVSLRDEDLALIAKMPKLEQLTIHFETLTSEGFTYLSNSKTLKDLFLDACTIDFNAVSKLARCRSLVKLKIQGSNSLRGATPSPLRLLKGLKVLNLRNTMLSDRDIAGLTDLPVEMLILDSNPNLTSNALSYLEQMPALRNLSLFNCNLEVPQGRLRGVSIFSPPHNKNQIRQ